VTHVTAKWKSLGCSGARSWLATGVSGATELALGFPIIFRYNMLRACPHLGIFRSNLSIVA
jgi:hypothetical protein